MASGYSCTRVFDPVSTGAIDVGSTIFDKNLIEDFSKKKNKKSLRQDSQLLFLREINNDKGHLGESLALKTLKIGQVKVVKITVFVFYL